MCVIGQSTRIGDRARAGHRKRLKPVRFRSEVGAEGRRLRHISIGSSAPTVQRTFRAGRFATAPRRFLTRQHFCESSVHRRDAPTWSGMFSDWWRCFFRNSTYIRFLSIVVLRMCLL